MGEFAQVAMGKPVGDRSGDRGSYRPHAQPNSFATCRHGNVRAHSARVSSPKLTASVGRGSTDNSPSCSRRSLRTPLQFPQDSGILVEIIAKEVC